MQVVLPPDSGPVEVIDRQGMQRPVRYELCPVVHVQQLLPSLHPPPSCYIKQTKIEWDVDLLYLNLRF